jgi:Domain of unknown function (DUF4249)
MIRFKRGSIISIFIFVLLVVYRCIEPFSPNLGVSKPLLVVEGLITNENGSNVVKLSYSFQKEDSIVYKVSDATVFLSDNSGNNIQLTENGEGVYKTDSINFKGEIGKTYQLHIKTSDGKVYLSNPCTMFPVPDIDSIYFSKDKQLVNNQTVVKEGISIYVDSKPGSSDKYFLRWGYDETWKFKVPDPTTYKYVNYLQILKISKDSIKEYCWKRGNSTEILINEVKSGTENRIMKEPIKFIAPDESDRLTVRYSILVKQYSISEQEYNFWDNLQKVNESEGDIFGSQPFEILSNIKNINDSSEKVLGYFQVSAVSEKRKYIDYSELYLLNLPDFNYNCRSFTRCPGDFYYNPVTWKPYTFDEIYEKYRGNYTFVEPIYYGLSTDSLIYLVFTSAPCADCELSGSFVKPDFWTDNN